MSCEEGVVKWRDTGPVRNAFAQNCGKLWIVETRRSLGLPG